MYNINNIIYIIYIIKIILYNIYIYIYIHIYIEQCFVCPNCTSSNKAVTFGCTIDIEVVYKTYNTTR